jgi:arginine decarboxylase
MEIRVASAVGCGPTPLAAFDAALRSAGVEDYNLIALSSVIPPGSIVTRTRCSSRPSEYGHRLYVVMAHQEAIRPGEEAWAGLGWTQEPESGRGLFVELHGSSRRCVEAEVGWTLDAMKHARRYAYGKNESEIAGVVCERDPVCALVIAVYASERWERATP